MSPVEIKLYNKHGDLLAKAEAEDGTRAAVKTPAGVAFVEGNDPNSLLEKLLPLRKLKSKFPGDGRWSTTRSFKKEVTRRLSLVSSFEVTDVYSIEAKSFDADSQ